MDICAGMIFTGKYFKGRVEVLELNEAKNELKVKLQQKFNAKPTDYHWLERWNLQHVKWGFDRGDYFLNPHTTPPPKHEAEALLLIECITGHTIDNQPTEEALNRLTAKVSDLLEDIIKRQTETQT